MSETSKFVRVDETLVTGDLYGSNHRDLLGVILKIEKPTKKEVIAFLAKNGERVDMGTLYYCPDKCYGWWLFRNVWSPQRKR